MVEFEYQPWKKIIIHEMVEYSVDDLMNMRIQGVTEGATSLPLNWANGILFVHQIMQPTEDVIKEQLKGIIHWAGLQYAIMPKYQSTVVRAGRITVPIINFSGHMIFGPLANWIKNRK